MEQYVYIKKSIYPHFVDFAEALKSEEYNNLGETYLDYLDNKWVLLDEELVTFLEENPNASVEEVWNKLIKQRTLQDAKNEKLIALLNRDSSSAVNEFIVKSEGEEDITDWLTPDQRANYRSSIDAAELLDVESLSLYVGGQEITLPTGTAKIMLARIQLYADQCFIVTKQHQANIKGLETIEAVDNYDITTGYPEKIVFNL